MDRILILAVRNEFSFVVEARIGTLLSVEVRAEHFLALGAISDTNSLENNQTIQMKIHCLLFCNQTYLWPVQNERFPQRAGTPLNRLKRAPAKHGSKRS